MRTLSVAKLGTIDYASALGLQRSMVEKRLRDEVGDVLLLLEHSHVYTLGRGADERFILSAPRGVPTYRVSRGGQVTYHGPGQLVGYPILKLEGASRDVTAYLRRLEQTMIDSLREFGIEARPRAGFTGVWVDDRKIGSIGVGIRRWVTYHGFALNVATDLSFFDAIVPCGITGCEMTSLAQEGRPDVSVDTMAETIARNFASVFAYAEVIENRDPVMRASDLIEAPR